MANNSEKTDKLLLFLDQELIEGHTKLQDLKDEHSPKDYEKWKVWQKSHCDKISRELDKWADSVKKYLERNSDKGQIKYHFLAGTDRDKLRENIEFRKRSGQPANTGVLASLPTYLVWTESDEIDLLTTQWEKYLHNLEEIILRLEDSRSIQIKKEIAEIQNKADTLYEIKYSDHTREIKLNNFIIAKPDFESENDRFFNYVYNNPNKPLLVKDIEKFGNSESKFKKRITDIVRDLGFNGKLRQLFFPVVSQEQVMFTNPITKNQAAENDLPILNLASLGESGRDRESKRGKTTKK